MSAKSVYLISGANRGVGYGLVATLAARPKTVVFAGARDPTAQSLTELSAKYSNVHPVKLTSGDEADNAAAVAEIQKRAGQLDVVIANAGISKYRGPIANTPPSEFRDHWEVNTLGPIVLFQAAHALLLASPSGVPTFALISSAVGSIGGYLPRSVAAYGSSKAAANFLVKVLDSEHPALISLAIHPGWAATDMGNALAVARGRDHAAVPVEDSVAGILSRIDGATKERTSGRFWNFKAVFEGNPWDIETDEIPW
ncbi:aflatoxin biosynthesis ketoreductase-like protein nor-1 [Mycena maculata]|uniref:Aflatoxin biosynthesis ketoreductase-like protein nor-1 n=1 Tax=Mycena maculata TaxID=230809 RepID=A0AAD7JMQ0_9AGAR|nr:aflatoxin biosynthesis ketoreductase-like protein nor-1 [Mycena maculata]